MKSESVAIGEKLKWRKWGRPNHLKVLKMLKDTNDGAMTKNHILCVQHIFEQTFMTSHQIDSNIPTGNW